MAFGNADQKERFLKPLARGDMLGAFCLTEPHVGSEAGGLKTTAVRDGDHYVLNGVKQFITSGKNGDVAIVMAVTDKAAGKKGISAFLVPTATPGYTVARIEDKMGQHASDTAQINFDNCRVPAANLLGDEGMGLKIALSGLEGGRIGIASRRAWAWRVRPSTRRWPTARSAELRPADLRAPGGAVQAGRHGHEDRGRAPADLARREPEGRRPPCLKEAAMAKLFASEMAERVCSAAIQVFGGYGYVSDFPVERIYRDVRVCQIYEGTSEVQKILIGRALAYHGHRVQLAGLQDVARNAIAPAVVQALQQRRRGRGRHRVRVAAAQQQAHQRGCVVGRLAAEEAAAAAAAGVVPAQVGHLFQQARGRGAAQVADAAGMARRRCVVQRLHRVQHAARQHALQRGLAAGQAAGIDHRMALSDQPGRTFRVAHEGGAVGLWRPGEVQVRHQFLAARHRGLHAVDRWLAFTQHGQQPRFGLPASGPARAR
jgi:butyryl-CoA dehydrogenase